MTEEADHYLIDTTTFGIGGTLLFWRPRGYGYTADVGEAGLFTKQEALDRQRSTHQEHLALSREVFEKVCKQTVVVTNPREVITALKGTVHRFGDCPTCRRPANECLKCGQHEGWEADGPTVCPGGKQ